MENLNTRLKKLLPDNLSRDIEKTLSYEGALTLVPADTTKPFPLKAAKSGKHLEQEVILHVENDIIVRILIPYSEVTRMEQSDDFTLGLMFAKYLQGGMRALRQAKASIVGGFLTAKRPNGEILTHVSDVAAVELRLYYSDKEPQMEIKTNEEEAKESKEGN